MLCSLRVQVEWRQMPLSKLEAFQKNSAETRVLFSPDKAAYIHIPLNSMQGCCACMFCCCPWHDGILAFESTELGAQTHALQMFVHHNWTHA